MQRPEITPENYEATYDFYTDYYNPTTARIGHALMGAVYHPNTYWGEGVDEEVQAHLEDGNALALMYSHSNINDQFPVAAMAGKEDALELVPGRAFIWAKSDLFQNWLLRRGVDAMGAVPIHRRKEFGDDPESDELRRKVKERLIACTTERINNGQAFAGFPEGTRNKGDTSKIQPIERGPGIIALGIDSERNFAMLAVAIHYPTFRFGNFKNRLRPIMYAGQLIKGPFGSVEEVQDKLHDGLQVSMDKARELTPRKLYRE